MATHGKIIGIYIASRESDPVHEVSDVEAVAGIGLKGDRYFYKQTAKSEQERRPECELTLIESESIDALNASGEFGQLGYGDIRRNVITQGIRLNELVGKTFSVGQVTAEGLELCEPCRHLEKLTGKNIMKPLVHQAGLRARIVSSGQIRKGDTVG